MEIIKTIKEMKNFARSAQAAGKTVALVPTMGYIHQGHLSLMVQARQACDVVVASIFVNPLQFGAGEDYEEYPRDLSRDAALIKSAGAAAIFAPSVAEMYPKGYQTFVEVEKITGRLCGSSRPGHFRGVTTVVSKLFNIVRPDQAFFGQKDAQQVLVLKKMTSDLNLDLEIITVPIVREADGLALSSRNIFLSPEHRKAALVLSRSLREAEAVIKNGERDAQTVLNQLKKAITAEPAARIDYVEVVSTTDLQPLETLEGEVLIALAVFFGKTRLIDNIMLTV